MQLDDLPAQATLGAARAALGLIEAVQFPPRKIEATADGTIVIAWARGNYVIEVEAYSDGRYDFLRYQPLADNWYDNDACYDEDEGVSLDETVTRVLEVIAETVVLWGDRPAAPAPAPLTALVPEDEGGYFASFRA